jgi:hypothetical protein
MVHDSTPPCGPTNGDPFRKSYIYIYIYIYIEISRNKSWPGWKHILLEFVFLHKFFQKKKGSKYIYIYIGR